MFSWCPLTSVPHDAVWFITGQFWADGKAYYENNDQKERFILNLDDQDIYIKLPAPKVKQNYKYILKPY